MGFSKALQGLEGLFIFWILWASLEYYLLAARQRKNALTIT